MNKGQAPVEIIPPAGLLICGYFEEKSSYEMLRPYGTRDWLITATVSGSGTYSVGGQSFTCRPGDIAILKPGTMHHYRTSPEGHWHFYWAHFLQQPDWPHYLQWPEALPGLLFAQIDVPEIWDRICGAFKRMREDSAQEGEFSEPLALHALKEVLMLTARQHNLRTKDGIDRRVQEVLLRLGEDLRTSRRIADLAKQVSLSPSRLSHLFKMQVGEPVMEVLLKMRVRQAARLLAYTDRQVQEIAEDVGFSSPFYFTEQFTKIMGENPSSYRKRHRKLAVSQSDLESKGSS
ncbi:helix-turn-helix domain-containing protein [Paenibacillus gansuensis]|uniref:Helix-turn-helix domain-containing protein n=1 Tax=Paenibacillus gansuensis TaxID=306542 RepID=A0ABW5P9N1_9BACL